MNTTYTITEAATELGMTETELLAFDQTLTEDSTLTQAEVDELAHVLANLDENGAYNG